MRKVGWIVLLLAASALAGFLVGVSGAQMVPVSTRAYDNNRSGWNGHEQSLTQATVTAKGIRRVGTITIPGDARGIEAQPLIQPHVKINGVAHDILLLASMGNVVEALDAQTRALLWQKTLGTPAKGGPSIDFHGINDHWGILSTPVIDPATQRVYLVAWISPDGTPQAAQHFVYVLNLTNGSLVVPPIPVQGTSGTQNYSAVMRKQRSSLLLTEVNGRKTVFWASGTVLETGAGAAGWVFALDCTSNRITAALALSQGRGAGIWMGGQGLAADAQGFLYAVTGNGSFNGTTDFAEAVVKIQYTPPLAAITDSATGVSSTPSGTLKVVDWWAPYTDAERTGRMALGSAHLPGKLAGMSAPSEALRPVGAGMTVSLAHAKVVHNKDQFGRGVDLVYPALANNAAWSDEDLGSGGGTLIHAAYGGPDFYLATGKDGIGYVVNASHMGKPLPGDFSDRKAVCAKLASPPVWLTASPGPVDPCPQDMTTLNFMPWGKTRHLHMTPVQYGRKLFVWGENSRLHEWMISDSGALSYVAEGNESASADITGSPGGMPGGFCTGSSNNVMPGTALLFCTIPLGDGNATVTNGRLLVYDPDHLESNPDGSKTLRPLWDSARWNIQFTFNKFLPPIVDGGSVFVPNYSGGVDIYQ